MVDSITQMSAEHHLNRRIRERAWALTWRSVSSLAILKDIRDGSSTTQLRRRLSDERYFPMSKRPTSASFPAPSVEVESTPSTTPATVPRMSPAVPKPDSNPYYFPPDSDDSDSDDESSSDESSTKTVFCYNNYL